MLIPSQSVSPKKVYQDIVNLNSAKQKSIRICNNNFIYCSIVENIILMKEFNVVRCTLSIKST